MPDPFQSDIGFDEEKQIRNTLEAVFDEARINGLPKKHWKRYRLLIFVTYFVVFRLREDPAILPPLNVKTYPGAVMRKGYTIGFDKLTQKQLDAMETELMRMKGMGVCTDAPLYATLHSLLTLAKTDGSSRWVITCITANDITVDYWWESPDNANAQQQPADERGAVLLGSGPAEGVLASPTTRGLPMDVLFRHTMGPDEILKGTDGVQSGGTVVRYVLCAHTRSGKPAA